MGNLQGELDRLVAKWQNFFYALPFPYKPIDLSRLKVEFNPRMRTRAGLCKPYQKVIELNPHLLENIIHLEEVFLHELCHMAVGMRWPYAQSHGEKWARLMGICGLKPQRCHALSPALRRPHRRWNLQCACGVHQVTTLVYNRIQKGMRYKCRRCKSLLELSKPA